MSNDTYLVRKTFLGDVQMKKDELRVSVDGLQCGDYGDYSTRTAHDEYRY